MAPETCRKLVDAGMKVIVESGAGKESEYSNDAYTEAGCVIGVPWKADVVAKIRPPARRELSKLSEVGAPMTFSHFYSL